MVLVDPLGWILSGGLQIIKLVAGGLGTSIATIGLGAVTLMFFVKFWPVINLLLFIYIFWQLNSFIIKMYNNLYKFLNRWVFPLVLPIVGDTLGIQGIGPKKSVQEIIIKRQGIDSKGKEVSKQ